MPRKSIDLLVATPPEWANVILDDFDEFLKDHANCERKASALAMSLVVKGPDRTLIISQLIALAREELAHFEQVYELMKARGVPLAKDTPDRYVNELAAAMRHGRDLRFLDRLLVSSIVECRGAERFRIIADALSEPELRRFYGGLAASEAKHGHLFADMALRYFDRETVYGRLHELAAREAEIIVELPWRPSLH